MLDARVRQLVHSLVHDGAGDSSERLKKFRDVSLVQTRHRDDWMLTDPLRDFKLLLQSHSVLNKVDLVPDFNYPLIKRLLAYAYIIQNL